MTMFLSVIRENVTFTLLGFKQALYMSPGVVINYREGEGVTKWRGGGGQVKFYPYKKKGGGGQFKPC